MNSSDLPGSEIGESGDELLGCRGGRLVEVDGGHEFSSQQVVLVYDRSSAMSLLRIPASGSGARPNRWWYRQGQSYDRRVAQEASALGEYLRARRERLLPEDVGLAATKRRRVAGLRREELATLAGISAAYYLRLEQGRATSPSTQVVDALARALRLDARSTQISSRPGSSGGSEIFPIPTYRDTHLRR